MKKQRSKKKMPKKKLTGSALEFTSVGLAAGAGLMSMDVFANYLMALHPLERRKKGKKKK